MENQYKELAKEFIETKHFLSCLKSFLKDSINDLGIKADIKIDKFGIGCGPITTLENKSFILRVYSSSYGSSNTVGSCYVVMQSKIPAYSLSASEGSVIRYSLTYYANNPTYLISHLKEVVSENKIWKKIKEIEIKEKYLNKPEKYFSKIEDYDKKLNSILNTVNTSNLNKIFTYGTKIKTLYLIEKQKQALKNKPKDKGFYNNLDILPYNFLSEFAKKHNCKVIGKSTKYYYNKNLKILFSQIKPDYPIKFITLDKIKFKKYSKKLSNSDFDLYYKLFGGDKAKTLLLLNSRLYL